MPLARPFGRLKSHWGFHCSASLHKRELVGDDAPGVFRAVPGAGALPRHCEKSCRTGAAEREICAVCAFLPGNPCFLCKVVVILFGSIVLPQEYALVAQPVEHLTFNQRARDSSSLERTKRTINR